MRSEKPKNHIAEEVFAKYQADYDAGRPVKNPEILLDQLTILQRQFIMEYLKHLNATKAVNDCGYNTKYPNRMATQLLHNPRIRLVINLLQEARARKSSVSKDWVLKKIQKIVEGTEEENPQAALRGLELIGKHLAMFVERQEISGKDGEAIQYQKVEEDARDFTRTIAGLAERAGTSESPLRVIPGGKS